jgi:alpha-1,3-rhamnosyl/mannosyltransferase
VVRLGYVPDEMLPKLMASAVLVVYPSTYEGFGLPVIEALATGTAVAASDLAVFREVGGDAVAYFDPKDPHSIASLVQACVEDSGADQARAGRIARARTFDWQASARIVADRLREFG